MFHRHQQTCVVQGLLTSCYVFSCDDDFSEHLSLLVRSIKCCVFSSLYMNQHLSCINARSIKFCFLVPLKSTDMSFKSCLMSCIFSPIDINRHISCEDCRSRVNGGFDPTTNQVYTVLMPAAVC